MTVEEQRIILEQAAKNGIFPGECPVCGARLVPSNRVAFAKVPNMNAPAVSFDCPNSESHIEAVDLDTYYISVNRGNPL